MTITVTHKFVSQTPDDTFVKQQGGVVPSDWNDLHDVSVTSLDNVPIGQLGAAAGVFTTLQAQSLNGFVPSASFSGNANELPASAAIANYTQAAIANAVAAQNQKDAVAAADVSTDVSITSAPASIGGVAMSGAATKRVLLAGKTSSALNGIYLWVAAGSPMARTADADTWDKLVNASVYVVGGTYAGQQYRCLVGNGGTLGTTAINWKQDLAVTVSNPNESYVSGSGNDTSTNGSIANPFRTVSAAQLRVGISNPHVFYMDGQSHVGWSTTSTNQTFAVKDPLRSAGKTRVSSAITFKSGHQYSALVGLTLTANAPIVIDSGNPGGNKIERCSWDGIGNTSLWSLSSGATGYTSIIGGDATGAPFAKASVPDMPSGYTINVLDMQTRFPISATGATGAFNVLVNIASNCAEGAVRVGPEFKGPVYWNNEAFAAPITEVITTQARLTAIIADTSGTDAAPRYYLINFASPTSFAQGAIFGKQSASNQTEHWWARTYDQAPSTIFSLADSKVYQRTGSLTWAVIAASSTTTQAQAVAKSWVADNSTSAGGAIAVFSTDEVDAANRTIDATKTGFVYTVPSYTVKSTGVWSGAGTLNVAGGGAYELAGANTVPALSVTEQTTVNVSGSIAPTGVLSIAANCQINRSTTSTQTWTNSWDGYGGLVQSTGAGRLTLAQSSAGDTNCRNSLTVSTGTVIAIALTGGGGYANWLGSILTEGLLELSLVDIRRHFFDCAVKGSGTIRVSSPSAVDADIYKKRATFRNRVHNLFTGTLELFTNAVLFFENYTSACRISMTDATAVLAVYGGVQSTVGGWNGVGTLRGENGPNLFAFGSDNQNSVWAGTTQGAISLIKQGVGRHTMNGLNNHTGTTTVSAGRLSGFGAALASAHIVSAGAKIGAAAPGSSGSYSIAKLNFSASTSEIDVHSDGAAVSQINLIETASDTMVASSGFRVNLVDPMPAGQFTIISAVNAPTLPAVLPVVWTNSSGRAATLAWVSGVGLRLTLV